MPVFPYLYGFDWTYLVLILPCIFLSLWTSISVKRTFHKFSQIYSEKGITAEEAAKQVLSLNGVRGVSIKHVGGNLTDHYDPTSNTISLSDTVYGSASVAAIGVACHEAGHAVQYAKRYFPIKVRTLIIPVTNFGSRLAIPLILIGFLLSYASSISNFFIYLGIICFSLSLLFQLITLPVEFNASRRAMTAIAQCNLLTPKEQYGAKKTLSAAAMTYLAAVTISLAQLLRLILLFGNRGRRRNN